MISAAVNVPITTSQEPDRRLPCELWVSNAFGAITGALQYCQAILFVFIVKWKHEMCPELADTTEQ